MTIYAWLAISSIIVAIIGIIVGIVGAKCIQISVKTKIIAKNTDGGPVQQAQVINNSGVDIYTAVKLSQDTARKELEAFEKNMRENNETLNNFNENKANNNQLSYANILHNWFFINPINQRGQNRYEKQYYTIDRWIISKGMVMELTSGGLQLSANEENQLLYQHIERSNLFAGHQLTMSIKCNDEIYYGTVTLPNVLTHGVKYGTFETPFGFVCLASFFDNELTFVIILNASKTYIIQSAKLELGKISTLSNDMAMDYGKELSVCQRFQIHTGEKPVRCPAVIENYNTISCLLPLPVTIRINPTVVTLDKIQIWNPVLHKSEDGFSVHTSITPLGLIIRAHKQNHGLTNAMFDLDCILFDANL